MIARREQPKALIHLLGKLIIFFDIQTNTRDLLTAAGFLQDMGIKPTKDPMPSPRFLYVHTLQPPKYSISPIAPLIGNKHLPNRLSGGAIFRNKIKPMPWVF